MTRRRHCLQAAMGLVAAAAVLPTSHAAQVLRRSWPAGRPTPALDLPGHDGPPWSLAAVRGQVVLLNFWASWCEPCIAELPSLEALARARERDGLVVVAINHRETPAAISRFTERHPTTLALLRDADGAAARAWGVRIFPTTIAIGRSGRAAFSVVGEADWRAAPARDWVAKLL